MRDAIKYIKASLLALAFFVLSAGPVLAAYSYYVPISIFNNGTTTYSNYSILVPITNSQLNTLGYINANGLDTAIGASGDDYDLGIYTVKLGFLVDTLYSGRTTNFNYWLGWSPARSSHEIVLGNTGYVTTPHSDTLEPAANNLTLEWSGYLDTSVTGKIIDHPGGYGIYTNSDGKIYAYVVSGTPAAENLLPNAAGDACAIDSQTGAACPNHYQNVDEAVGFPDDDTTDVHKSAASTLVDYYNLADTAVPSNSAVVSIDIIARTKLDAASSKSRAGVRLGGVDSAGTERSGTVDWTTYTDTAIARPGGGSWAPSDLNSLQVMTSLTSVGSGAYCTQTYVTVNYCPATTISAARASGRYVVRLTKSGTDLKLYADNMVTPIASSAAAPATIYHSPGAYTLCDTPCRSTSYVLINVNGGLDELKYMPTNMPSTILTDTTGGTHDGTINWGFNPAAFEVTIGGVVSPTSYIPPGGNTTVTTPQVLIPIPVPTAVWYENTTKDYSTMPIYGVMTMAANSLEWPIPVLYGVMMFITAIALGFAFFVGTGSLTFGVIGMGGTLGLAASTGILGFWFPLIIILVCIMLVAVLRGL